MTQNLKLTLLKSWRPPSTLQHLLLVRHSEAWRGTLKSFTKNLAGKFFITGGGEDVFASYTLEIPQGRIFHYDQMCIRSKFYNYPEVLSYSFPKLYERV